MSDHVLAFRLHQPFETIAGRLEGGAGLAAEMTAIPLVKTHKTIGDLIDWIDARISMFK